MARSIRLYAALTALSLGAAACTPAADTAKEPEPTTTIVETREVQVPPVVVERQVPPPVVIDADRRDGDSTTVRAGRDGIEVETTNR